MKKTLLTIASTLLALPLAAQTGKPNVVAFYVTTGEQDHIDFAEQAIQHYSEWATKDGFNFRATTNWDELNPETLAKTDVVMWLNNEPNKPAQREAFQNYMEHGGHWMGTHVSAYNDRSTKWTWFPQFLGGTVFSGNQWPPLPAKLVVEVTDHPVTQGLPKTFMAPANEWYTWKPSARANPDVKVLVSFDPSNYPIGFKDRLLGGDMPVVWTNTKYHMLYLNMGHGDRNFDSPIENKLWENSLIWLLKK